MILQFIHIISHSSGGGIVILPGCSTPTSAGPTSSRNTDPTTPVEANSLPPLPLSGSPAKGSGESYFASEDLMTVRLLHLSHYILIFIYLTFLINIKVYRSVF